MRRRLINHRERRRGFPLVLTADRILMADYDVLLDGMTAASQTTSVPEPAMKMLVSPPVPKRGIRARRAPLGLRLIEAALLDEGFPFDDMILVAPEDLDRAVGPDTQLVLVSSGDPCGQGMNNSTMAGIGGGRPYTEVWFERTMTRLKELKQRHGFRVLLGGPGAWQLERDEAARARLGIDVVFCGYAESSASELIRALCEGRPAEAVIHAPEPPDSPTRTVRGATSMGVVEISRGCGLGCPFCSVGPIPMMHAPIEQIVANVRVNIRGGVRNQCLISEDFLRYGAQGARLNPQALLEMTERVRAQAGLGLLQLDHVNVSSAARFPIEDLRRLHETLVRGQRHEYLWVNLGVETANGRLLAAGRCRGKLHPFKPDQWEGACREAIENLLTAGFTPMISLMFGLPGETREDIARTLRLVEDLRECRLVIFPLFLAPTRPEQTPFTLEDMTPMHWSLLRRCYELNFKWLPRIYWDNQAGAHVHWLRRLAVQLGGRARVLDWRLRFIVKSGKLRP